MQARKLNSTLNRLGKRVNALYPDINHGGCCVYAAIVADELDRLGVPARGIVATWTSDRGDTDIDEIRNYVECNNVAEWEENGVFFTHVGIEYNINGKIKHCDSNGVKDKGNILMSWAIYKGRLMIHELKQLARSGRDWNKSFDRKDIPAIRRLIKTELRALA